MNMLRTVLLPLFLIGQLLLINTSCSAKKNNKSTGLHILATTTIVGDVVTNIAGDKTNLHVLLPPGASPHSFEPSPRDIAKASNADLIFINGAGLEQFIDKLIQNSGSSAEVVSLSENLKLRSIANTHDDQDESKGLDPHVWTDPNNVISWVDVIVKHLSEIDSANSKLYYQNGILYKQKLQELDHWITEQISKIPQKNRKLVTDHMLFGYFCERYGFEQTGAIISGFSTLSEPSAQDVAKLEDSIRKMNVKAILVGNTVNPSMAEQIAGDTGAKLFSFYTGSLSEKGGPADTYIKYMRYNVDVIVKALQ